MRTTRQLSITLPIEMAELVTQKVSAGHYASESEVIRDGLRILMARERLVETWLSGAVADAYDQLQSDPNVAVSIEAVRQRLGLSAII